MPCRVTLAATGPVTLSTWPPAPPAASPTPCGGPCAPATLPPLPLSSPSCPPNYIVTSGGCAPAPTPNPGPRYHVTISLASPTMTVGGTDSLTAQATLVNPGSAPAGTPSSIPVAIQQTTDATCTATPPGSQPSGSTFTLTGISSGTCTVVIQGDASAVPGATSDSTPVTATVSGSPSATPSPKPCDLVTNGKCYVRIVDMTDMAFSKYVAPEISCDLVDPQDCHFVDAIQNIQLTDWAITPGSPPTNPPHELLFKIDEIHAVSNKCMNFALLSTFPTTAAIPWNGPGIGGPANGLIGLGQPSVYSTVNHVVAGATTFSEPFSWPEKTVLPDLYNSVATGQIGDPYTFTYSGSDAITGSSVHWYPDFPGCDTVVDSPSSGRQYGIAVVELVFEVYQAMP